MPGFLTRGGGENVPGISGACATRNFTYLVRRTWTTYCGWNFNERSLKFPNIINTFGKSLFWIKVEFQEIFDLKIVRLGCFDAVPSGCIYESDNSVIFVLNNNLSPCAKSLNILWPIVNKPRWFHFHQNVKINILSSKETPMKLNIFWGEIFVKSYYETLQALWNKA